MANLNKVFMIGRLTKDPDLKYLPNGTPKAELRLATSREWKDKSGEKQKDVCYVDVIVWSRQAEIAKQYLAKGRQVFIEGRLDFQEWERDGQRRSKHQIVADRVQFLDRGNEGGGAAGQYAGQQQQQSYGGQYGGGGGGASYGGGGNSGGGYGGGGGGNYGGGNSGGNYGGGGGKTYGGNGYQDAPPPAAPQQAPMAEAMDVPPSDLPF